MIDLNIEQLVNDRVEEQVKILKDSSSRGGDRSRGSTSGSWDGEEGSQEGKGEIDGDGEEVSSGSALDGLTCFLFLFLLFAIE